jgi:hypothetical protein
MLTFSYYYPVNIASIQSNLSMYLTQKQYLDELVEPCLTTLMHPSLDCSCSLWKQAKQTWLMYIS